MIVMLKELLEHVFFRIFKRLRYRSIVIPSVACTRFWMAIFRHALARCRTLTKWQAMSAVRIPTPFVDALFRLHYTLKGMYLEGNLNEYRPSKV